jgi:NAD(P)-dependent dehydrogenase (short-subunit alcohol dehydrogenase family)
MHIKDRSFIISGGASGLGLATARDLHARGGYIAILDLNADNGAKIVSELGPRTNFFETDVSETTSVEAAVTAAGKRPESLSRPSSLPPESVLQASSSIATTIPFQSSRWTLSSTSIFVELWTSSV